MTSVRTSYYSGVGGNDPSITLFRVNPVTGVFAKLIDHIVLDDSGTRTYVNAAVPANLGLVSNALHAITYRLCLGGADYFFGARIAYQYTNAGD